MIKQLKKDQKPHNQSVSYQTKQKLLKKNCKKTQVFEPAGINLLLQKGVLKKLKTLTELQANWEQ
jgi:hypothetical protein